jgi:hypothetical protein
MENPAKNAPKFECEFCDFHASKLSNWTTHLSTRKHQDSILFSEKKGDKYFCKICNLDCDSVSDLQIHKLSLQHRDNIKAVQNEAGENSPKYKCDICDKEYESNNSLWYHKKKCTAKKKEDEEKEAKPVLENTIVFNQLPNILTDFIAKLYNENQEIRSLVLEQQKKTEEERRQNQEKAEEERRQNQEKADEERRENKDLINKLFEMTQQQLTVTNNNITNLNTINNNNQRFNLNVFLNETCKDAMNLDEFLDTIRPTFDELLVMGDVGFVSGISDIFIKRLRALDITKRPIHCTDAKRETIFLKENNVWTKDDNGHSRLNSIIEKVEYRNVVCLHQWCLDNPDAMVNNHEKNLLRDKIYLQTLLGDPKTREKVVRNIAKEVALDREAIMLQFGRR